GRCGSHWSGCAPWPPARSAPRNGPDGICGPARDRERWSRLRRAWVSLVERKAAERRSGREVGLATRGATRYGCFLPDLTGLARRPSTANLPTATISGFHTPAAS